VPWHAPNAPKVTKRSCSYVRPARWGSGFLRSGIHPGGIAYGLLRCTSSRCVWLRQTVAALPPPDKSLHSAFRRRPKIRSGTRANAHRFEWWEADTNCFRFLWEPACWRWRPTSRPVSCRLHAIPVGASLVRAAIRRKRSARAQQRNSQTSGFLAHKRNSASAFKVHEPLRHKGYDSLRRCLRVRQNPPAYAAWRGLYRFPVTQKWLGLVARFELWLLRHLQCCLFSEVQLCMVGMRGAHSWAPGFPIRPVYQPAHGRHPPFGSEGDGSHFFELEFYPCSKPHQIHQ